MTGQLSEMAVLDYQQIHKNEFNEEISYEEARAQAERLLRIFSLIYRPLPKSLLAKK